MISRQMTPARTFRRGGSVLSIPEAAGSGKVTPYFWPPAGGAGRGDQEPLIGRETVKALP